MRVSEGARGFERLANTFECRVPLVPAGVQHAEEGYFLSPLAQFTSVEIDLKRTETDDSG